MKGHGPFDVLLRVPGQVSESDHCFTFEVISRDKIVVKHGEYQNSVADLILWDDAGEVLLLLGHADLSVINQQKVSRR